MLKLNAVAVAVAFAALASGALASNASVTMTVTQSDGSTWIEDLSGLVVTDAQNNFSMVQGTGTSGYFLNGSFVGSTQATGQADYWQWSAASSNAAASWNWHSAQTLTGASPAATDASDPWESAIKLQDLSGRGDPDMVYAVSVINNSTLSQTYTFSFSEAVAPTVSGANATYADLTIGLTNRTGSVASMSPVNASGIQRFELSADNGTSYVNAGVDVGQGSSTTSTSGSGVYRASNANGPTDQTWNTMQLVSSFTLSGKSAASLTGFASVTPVPEPQMGTMLLLGVGMIGTIIRRRRTLWM